MKFDNLNRILGVKNGATLSVRENRNCNFKQRMAVDYLSAVIFCFTDMLDKNHLASTVRTIYDWYIVNVAGM